VRLNPHHRWLRAAASGVIAVLLVAPAHVRAGEQRTVVEEILDILKARGQISDREYRELNERARQEEEQRRKAAQPVVAPAPVPAAPAEQPSTAVATAPADKSTFRAFWKDGLRFENSDQTFKMRIGGRLQLDAALFGPSGALQSDFELDSFESGVEFRRARLYTEGVIYEDYGWKFEYDFADQAFKDVYLEATDVPGVQQVRLGFYKEPLSLEELTSDNFTTFMERGLPNAFSPSRKTGVGTMMTFLDDRITWGAGVFRGDSDDLGEGFGGEQAYDLTTRLTALPWYDDASNLLYVGLGYSHQFRSNFEVTYSARPEAHLVPSLVRAEFVTDGIDLLDPSIALVLGPFSAQAEYIQTFVQGADDFDDPRFFGWYAFLSYFPTGESRGFRLDEAAFNRVYPKKNFGWGAGSGWGALEVALRQSQLNLNSAGVDGGRLNDTTLGLTWYLNPNMRILANYVYSNRTPQSSANVYEWRVQVDY
jgi:phosphate-selective porin OprO and OprP